MSCGVSTGATVGFTFSMFCRRMSFSFLLLRIVDDNFQHEAVELRFGQRVGAFLLDGVLRGHHQERLFQLVRGFADGDLAFLHGFEQGALHLGRGAVYFIRQDEVGENRSFF